MEGGDRDVQRRLLEIAPLPNWRNVFLFASGKCFGERQHLRDTVHSICATLNETDGDDVAGSYLVGSGLAMDLLEDGLSRHQPRVRAQPCSDSDASTRRTQRQFSDTVGKCLRRSIAGYLFAEEVARRLADEKESVRLGTWNCLIRLVGRECGVGTAVWPMSTGLLTLTSRMNVLQASVGFWRNQWSAAKFVELMPQYSVSRIRELFHVGLTASYESNVFHRMRANPSNDLGLLPHQEAMVKTIGPRYQ